MQSIHPHHVPAASHNTGAHAGTVALTQQVAGIDWGLRRCQAVSIISFNPQNEETETYTATSDGDAMWQSPSLTAAPAASTGEQGRRAEGASSWAFPLFAVERKAMGDLSVPWEKDPLPFF